MKETVVPESACPSCNHLMDRASDARGDDSVVPTPGCLSICIRCGAIAEFDDKLLLKALPDGKLAEIRLEDPRTYRLLMKAQRHINQQKKKGGWIE